MTQKKVTKNFGFTLVELLVVIAIISLLSTIAIVGLQSARIKTRNAKRLADVKQLSTALEMFYDDNGHYPDKSFAQIGEPNTTILDSETGFTNSGSGTIYMAKTPLAPKISASDIYIYVAYKFSAPNTVRTNHMRNCYNGQKCDYYTIWFQHENNNGTIKYLMMTPEGIVDQEIYL